MSRITVTLIWPGRSKMYVGTWPDTMCPFADPTAGAGGGARHREGPRDAVWGGALNLRKQVEPLFESHPSGFLTAEACTRGGVAIHLGLALAQANLREPARAPQGRAHCIGTSG